MKSLASWIGVCFCGILVTGLASAEGTKAAKPPEPQPAVKPSPPTLKDVERTPERYLGSRLTLDALLGSENKPANGMIELKLFADAKTPANRVRYVASKSIADQLTPQATSRPIKLTGSVAAPESVRAGYSFEIEEIALLDADGKIVTTLKPVATAGVKTEQPTPEAVASPTVRETSEPKLADVPKKKNSVPPLLIVGAVVLAIAMAAAVVVGIRVSMFLKKKPAAASPRIGDHPKPTTGSAGKPRISS